MRSIKDIHNEFVKQTLLPVDWKQQLYNILSEFKPEDIRTLEEHKMYVETLHKLRNYNAEDMKLNGKKFLDTIASLLAVGNDGLYSNDLRFIYELIQNVDDCEYEDIEDCHLDIKFEYDPAPGKIILTYNEMGFKPFNVFAITGIAEESKNITADKVEIGEKGIGFKSVFGVAKKVYIESGMFSFELHKDNFTVPIPKYEDFKPIKGTRLTIYLDNKHNAKQIHEQLLRQYEKRDAILNQNPILFLNKLTHLKMYFDGWRFIEFDVEKRKLSSDNEIIFEDDVIVSVDMHSYFNSREAQHNSIISCRRYTMPITYGLNECKSRYGDNIQFNDRKHNIIAVFPKLEETNGIPNGLLYSFLPTQIKISAPFVLHVPYKLDGSRQFVDQQGYNAWFEFTNQKLGYSLKKVYIDLATRVKNEIVKYLPSNGTYFFKHDNDKVKCIQIPELRASTLYKEKIFYCADGTFECGEKIISFEKGFENKNSIRIFELLGENRKLFIPYSKDVDMNSYKVTVLSNVMEKLFESGLCHEDKFSEIAAILDKEETAIPYFDIIAKKEKIELSIKQIMVIASYKKMLRSFQDLSHKYIERRKRPSIILVGDSETISSDNRNTIVDLVEAADLEPVFEMYIRSIGYNFVALSGRKNDFYLACSNTVLLSKDVPLGAFGSLSAHYDPRKTFSATLQIRQASDMLNNASEEISNSDYLKLLRGVRNSLVVAFGKKAYTSYISIINSAGSDKSRFLFELLQNADDCSYYEDVIPKFTLTLDKDELLVSYNEVGFTKDNVRAITAIGESTKKLLLNGDDRAIGEKGVGFKSVFGVADYVDIHSNGFDFRLTSDLPTVPEKIDPLQKIIGTVMRYKLKDRNIKNNFIEEKILRTCICLRNLRQIDVCGIKVTIDDADDVRLISIHGKTYKFERIVYEFDVEDEEAIAERNTNQKSISKHQYIACYIPPKNYKCEQLTLYSGLPVSKVECNIPLIIDAPFELTTARDDILESKWNDCVYDALYEAIINVIELKKRELKLDVLKYVHYQNQNGTYSFQIFNKRYLNGFDWVNQLKQMKILPLYDGEKFVFPDNTKRIIPEIIATVVESVGEANISGTVIDTRKKSQYTSLLELLGCKKLSANEEVDFFHANLNRYLTEKKQRDTFYDYLATRRLEYESKKLADNIRNMEIFPIRVSSGYTFIAYSSNIYTHPSQKSSDEFLILDTEVMTYEKCQDILGSSCRINQLSQEVYDARYRKKIEDMIASNEPDEKKAKFLLREFKSNFAELKKCKPSLVGLLKDIPMEMANGVFCTGNKFINEKDLILEGTMIKWMYVSEQYRAFAEFLGCSDILQIHYSDIDIQDPEVSDTDIEDILSDFKYYIDILSGMFEDNLISEEQIEKFNLQFLGTSSNTNEDDEDEDEDFPGKRVHDIKRLKNHIKYIFEHSPNPYVQKKRIVREPRSKVNKNVYTVAMYGSINNNKKCFCQMCQRLVKKTYIERNDVQKKPKYGWEQMYLSLCLNCSKDYIYLRNNQTVWKHFVNEIINTDVMDKSTIEIAIGDRKIAFTATHLAEIQEIFELESTDFRDYGDVLIDAMHECEEEEDREISVSQSSMVSGHSINDAEDEEIVDVLIMPDSCEYTSIEKIVAANPGKLVIVVKQGWTNDYCLCVEEFTGKIKAEGKIFLNGEFRSETWVDRRHKCFKIYDGPSIERIKTYYN